MLPYVSRHNMDVNSHSTLKLYLTKIYKYLCVISTLLLVGYSICVYIQNNDISRIHYKEFHSTANDIYPSISLCFGDTLDDGKLDAYGTNKTSYLKFLKGIEAESTLHNINFNEMSINLTNYLLGIELYKNEYNGESQEDSYFFLDYTAYGKPKYRGNIEWKPNMYQNNNPFYGMIQQCFTVDIPFIPSQQTSWITIIMSRSVFLKGKRPYNAEKSKDVFAVDIHYPGQRYRFAYRKSSWMGDEPKDTNTNSYGIKFVLTNLEVMHQRNTRNTACRDQFLDDDEALRMLMIKNISCIPPYWIKPKDGNATVCSTKDKLRRVYNMDAKKYISPCRRITLANIEHSEYPTTYYNEVLQLNRREIRQSNNPESFTKNVSLDYFYVTVFFKHETYKEIVLTRQFDLQNLIGNAGGYVGICVGYSFLQLPKLITYVVSKVRLCSSSE